MPTHVSVAQAKAEFAAVVARAEAGEEVVITRNGRPVARLMPMAKASRLPYGDLSDLRLPEDISLPADVIDAFYPETDR